MAVLALGDRNVDVKAVIFDKDGTLIQFEPIWLEIAKVRCREIVRMLDVDSERGETLYRSLMQTMGVNPDTLHIHPRGPLAIAPRIESMIAVTTGLFLQGYHWDEAREIVGQAYSLADTIVDRKAQIVPIAGMVDMLQDLHASGVKICIATTDAQHGVDMLVDKLGIRHLIDFAITGDKTPCHKPAPDMIQITCDTLGFKPHEVIMVGDAPVDLIMGKAAGVAAAVGVATGVSSRELLEAETDVVLNSIVEIRVLERGEIAQRFTPTVRDLPSGQF